MSFHVDTHFCNSTNYTTIQNLLKCSNVKFENLLSCLFRPCKCDSKVKTLCEGHTSMR